MKKYSKTAFYIDAQDMGDHCGDQPEFLAQTLYHLGRDEGFLLTPAWLRDFAAALGETGEAALRQLVARLDAIDATSTEGR